MPRRASALTVFLALACNEMLGLDPGTLGPKDDRGESSRGGEGSGLDGETSCSTTADCIEHGLAAPKHLCLAGACVDVLTEECDTLLGAEWLEEHPEDQPIVFGAIDGEADERSASYFSLELAMKEFAEHGPVPIDGASRRPVLLICSVTSPDPFSAPTQRSLDHLLDHVRVPGMVMIQSRSELLASVRYAFGEKRTDAFFIDVGAGNDELFAGRFDGGRLWHMSGDGAGISVLYSPVVRLVEEHVNPGASSGHGARLTRVAMVLPDEDDGIESDLAVTVDATVYTNDRPMASYPDTYRMVIAKDRPWSAANEVASFEPDIVIDFAGIYALIEAYSYEQGRTPPFYVLPPSQARSPELLELIAADSTLRTRILGVAQAGPDEAHKPLYDAYLERLAAIAPVGVDGSASANVYEAVYFLTYAAVAGGRGGSNMNRGMTRLLGLLTSSRRDIGPASIGSVIALLGTDPSLSLHGALGPPSFDPNSGGRHMPGSVWCIDESPGFAMDALRLGQSEPGVSELIGAFPCFDL